MVKTNLELILALQSTGLNSAQIKAECDKEIENLSGLIEKDSALLIVAKNHGIDTSETALVPIEAEPTENDILSDFEQNVQDKFSVRMDEIFQDFKPHEWQTLNVESNKMEDMPHKCLLHILEKRLYKNKLSGKDDWMYKTESVFPGNEKVYTEIIFGFSSFNTQYMKLCIVPGDVVFMNYSGKVASPTHPGWNFKSCFLKKVGHVDLIKNPEQITSGTGTDVKIPECPDMHEPTISQELKAKDQPSNIPLAQLGKLDAKKKK